MAVTPLPGRVAVVVPFGRDHLGPSDESHWRCLAFEWVWRWWRAQFPDVETVIGSPAPNRPWSKGEAVRSGMDAYHRLHGTPDVWVVADADSYTTPDAVRHAITEAAAQGWAMPHRFVYRQSRDRTDAIYRQGVSASMEPVHLDRPMYRGVKAGGIIAITPDAWEQSGGIDPRFYGWGGEDRAFEIALNLTVGRRPYGPGPLFHLWHPHPAPDLRGSPESEALIARYREAATSRSALAALIAERLEPV